MTGLQERIRAGMAYLDVRFGKRWRKRISVKDLDLGVETSCILGQLHNEYSDLKEALALSNRTAYDLAFSASPTGDNVRPSRSTWFRLTKAWKKALST